MLNKSMFYAEKSPTYFNLYNPPFCGHLLRICLAEYEGQSKKPMTFPLAFLILPILLRKELRDTINHHTDLHAWTFENYSKLVDFNKQTTELIDLTKSALIFLLQNHSISITKEGKIKILNYKNPKTFLITDEDIREFYKKSRYLGKWLAFIDDVPTVFSLLE